MRTSSHTEETMQKYKKWTASLAVTGVALLMTAENDKVVHLTNTTKMAKALTKAGATVVTEEVKKANHATSIAAMSTSLTWVNTVRPQLLNYLQQKLQ